MDIFKNQSVEELLSSFKIVSAFKGHLETQPENLKSILDSVRPHFQDDLPVAFLAVVGSNGSSKSLLTNIFMHYLGNKGYKHNEWMTNTIEADTFTESRETSDSMFYQRGEAGSPTSGVYLYPEPFLMEKSTDKKIVAWLLHVHGEENKDIHAIQEFLTLTCSRIMEIKWSENEDSCSEKDNSGSAVCVLSCETKTPTGAMDEDAMYQLALDKLQGLNLTEVKNCSEAFPTDNEVLDIPGIKNDAAEADAIKAMKNMIEKMLEESEIHQKKTKQGEGLTLANMHAFLVDVAHSVNSKMAEEATEKEAAETSSDAKVTQVQPSDSDSIRTPTNCNTTASIIKETVELLNEENDGYEMKSKNTLITISSYIPADCPEACATPSQNEQVDVPLHRSNSHQQFHPNQETILNSEIVVRGESQYTESSHSNQISNDPPLLQDTKVDLDESPKDTIESTSVQNEVEESISVCPLSLSEVAIQNKALVKTKVLADVMDTLDNMEVENATEAKESRVDKEKATNENEVETLGKKAEVAVKLTVSSEEKELRQLEEKARAEFEKCVTDTVSQLKHIIFPPSIKYWIQYHLTLTSIHEINNIYDYAFHGFIVEQEKQMVVSRETWLEIVCRLDSQCQAECVSTLQSISQAVVKINRALKRQFWHHGYLTHVKLAQIANQEFENETGAICKGFVLDMIMLAVDKLLGIYIKDNATIFENEKKICKIARDNVLAVYYEEMNRYMINIPCSPLKLQSFHSRLKKELIEAFKNATRLGITADMVANSKLIILEECINQEFEQCWISNQSKIKELLGKVKKIYQNVKNQYNERVEDVLVKNPDGLDEVTLDKYRTSIEAELKKLLGKEIRGKIRVEEPLASHEKVLQEYFDMYWLIIIAENNKNIKEKQARDGKEQREKCKVEAQEKAQEQEKTSVNEQGNGEVLPPLVFHLQSSHISMAMDINGHATILKNELGEERTPACVVLVPPPENAFIYGYNAQHYLELVASSKSEVYHWTIADFFRGVGVEWNITYFLKGKAYPVTSEFLLAFLLRKLKHAAEQEGDGTCDTALLVIPFWLTSTQRLKVKHAAKMAGFSAAYLINESSAAAFNFVSCSIPHAGDALVISENADRVDVFVYHFSPFDKKIRMIAHSSSYNNDGNPKKRGCGFKGLSKCVSSLLSTQGADWDIDVQNVQDACKVALEKASRLRGGARVVLAQCLFISENGGKWSKIFQTAVVANVERAASLIREETAVLFGAVALGREPNKMADILHDKLAYSIFRSSNGGKLKIVTGESSLPIRIYGKTITLPNGHAFFYQRNFQGDHLIGKLLIEGVHYNHTLELNLEITNEAIVSLKCDIYKSREFKYSHAEKRVHWITPNLSKESRNELAHLLASLAPFPGVNKNAALSKARNNLLQKCQEMVEKIETEQFKIKSSLAKSMVLEKISVAREFAMHKNSSLESIQSQMEALQKLWQKYDKK